MGRWVLTVRYGFWVSVGPICHPSATPKPRPQGPRLRRCSSEPKPAPETGPSKPFFAHLFHHHPDSVPSVRGHRGPTYQGLTPKCQCAPSTGGPYRRATSTKPYKSIGFGEGCGRWGRPWIGRDLTLLTSLHHSCARWHDIPLAVATFVGVGAPKKDPEGL